MKVIRKGLVPSNKECQVNLAATESTRDNIKTRKKRKRESKKKEERFQSMMIDAMLKLQTQIDGLT